VRAAKPSIVDECICMRRASLVGESVVTSESSERTDMRRKCEDVRAVRVM